MTLQVFPSTPVPSFPFEFEDSFNVIASGLGGENEERQPVGRFSRRYLTLLYKVLQTSDWKTVRDFFIRRRGGLEAFWFFDFSQRSWIDEYVGRGGPFDIDGAALYDVSSGFTIENEAAANETEGDMHLLPDPLAQYDGYLFGFRNKVHKITLRIHTSGVGSWTIAWKYWNGSAWYSLSGVSDGTSGFTASPGDYDITFTMPSDWVDYIPEEATSVQKLKNLYYIFAQQTDASPSLTTQPLATQAWGNTKYYDLPSKSTVNDSSLKVYVNSVEASKTFISGGGGGGADRFYFADYQSQGDLITADLTGLLRIKGIFPDRMISRLFSTGLFSTESIRIREIR